MSRSYRAALTSPRLAVPFAIAAAVAGFVALTVVGRSPPANSGQTAAARTVAVRRSKLGRILVDAHGRTLYLFREDHGSKSTCFGGCARVWPPLLVAGRPVAGPGVDAAKLTARPRRHSRLQQVTYNGHPLYTTVADKRPGQFEGQGWLGTWFVVSPAGRQIGKASKNAGGY
ncbi:MAG: COG4315 family predicted lipoprotein [Solirubrobacteraceae bacterium]